MIHHGTREEFGVKGVKGAKMILTRQEEIKHCAKNNVKLLKTRDKQIRKRRWMKNEYGQEIDLEVSWITIKRQTQGT